ncbi:hypothetical protein [Ferruginibacter sp.]
MKYKHVFLVWLLADVFLAIGLFIFILFELSGTSGRNNMDMFLWVCLYGIVVSLPSLAIMLIFHAVFMHNAKDPGDYKMPYMLLIIGINFLYLLITANAYRMGELFNLFYMGSTVAGLLAFYIVDRKIKKQVVAALK